MWYVVCSHLKKMTLKAPADKFNLQEYSQNHKVSSIAYGSIAGASHLALSWVVLLCEDPDRLFQFSTEAPLLLHCRRTVNIPSDNFPCTLNIWPEEPLIQLCKASVKRSSPGTHPLAALKRNELFVGSAIRNGLKFSRMHQMHMVFVEPCLIFSNKG